MASISVRGEQGRRWAENAAHGSSLTRPEPLASRVLAPPDLEARNRRQAIPRSHCSLLLIVRSESESRIARTSLGQRRVLEPLRSGARARRCRAYAPGATGAAKSR